MKQGVFRSLNIADGICNLLLDQAWIRVFLRLVHLLQSLVNVLDVLLEDDLDVLVSKSRYLGVDGSMQLSKLVSFFKLDLPRFRPPLSHLVHFGLFHELHR